jgi:hypothetical protein
MIRIYLCLDTTFFASPCRPTNILRSPLSTRHNQTRQGEADYRNSKWAARSGELMMGFMDLPDGGVRCSMAYFTLLPVPQGESVTAGHFYEYSGTFIAPLDSAVLSVVVGYGQHVWVDYVKLDILHDGSPRDYECTMSSGQLNTFSFCFQSPK